MEQMEDFRDFVQSLNQYDEHEEIDRFFDNIIGFLQIYAAEHKILYDDLLSIKGKFDFGYEGGNTYEGPLFTSNYWINNRKKILDEIHLEEPRICVEYIVLNSIYIDIDIDNNAVKSFTTIHEGYYGLDCITIPEIFNYQNYLINCFFREALDSHTFPDAIVITKEKFGLSDGYEVEFNTMLKF